jgi:hypothetical protein
LGAGSTFETSSALGVSTFDLFALGDFGSAGCLATFSTEPVEGSDFTTSEEGKDTTSPDAPRSNRDKGPTISSTDAKPSKITTETFTLRLQSLPGTRPGKDCRDQSPAVIEWP